jgi:hypothetical protein
MRFRIYASPIPCVATSQRIIFISDWWIRLSNTQLFLLRTSLRGITYFFGNTKTRFSTIPITIKYAILLTQ